MINLIVSGASGRMGKEVLESSLKDSDVKVLGGLARSQSKVLGVECVGSLDGFSKEILNKVNVIIDFSLPEALDVLLDKLDNNPSCLVSGTTGFNSSIQKKMEDFSKKAPVLWASNMSIGVAFVGQLLSLMGQLKDDFDFQVTEFHHNKKLDKPSGTAKTLHNKLLDAVKKEIPEPLAIRGGGIFGEHQIYAMSDEEVISIEHKALNRSVFAKGALACSKWLIKQKPGLYTIEDFLNSK